MEFDNIQDFRRNFFRIYHSDVVRLLRIFEKSKLDIQRKTKCIKIIGILISVILLIVLLTCFQNANLFLSLIPVSIAYSMCKYACKKFEIKLKSMVMPEVMRAFGDFVWIPNGTISVLTLKQTRLFDRFENQQTDDCFYGTYKGLKINIDEIELTYTTRDSKGNRQTHTEFDGVIVRIDFNKPFKGHTIIRKRELLNTKVYEEIKLEDPEFSKMYFVDGSDQIESRYILTPSFMERFKNIKIAFNASGIEASIRDDKILIAISTGKDLFKLGDIKRPVNDTKQFNELLNEFVSILEIVDELRLNQNIGL